MFPFTHVSLIRYLIVWRVNRSLVQMPPCPSVEFSRVLGHLIARRLPTQTARQWRRAFSERDPLAKQDSAPTPSHSELPTWPLETVLFVYPGKRIYGPGEPILWELKMLGEAADHGLFLEWILPAIEEAATHAAPSPYSLWGRFDIQAVYVARGQRWEPLVQDGKLDLRYQPRPTQWRQGLTFGEEERRYFHSLNWITPFDLRIRPALPALGRPARLPSSIPPEEVPTLQDVLEALMARMTVFLPGKHHTPEEGWGWLDPEEQTALRLALQEAREPPLQRPELKPAPKGWPGRWIGTQTFGLIPLRLLPYLEMASILHIGRQTHFGCGTFRLDLFHRP